MISVAAELASMHPQTLRIYESRGLITPQRSPKGTRLYSQEDVDRLRRIQELTSELGMNLAGVERVFELEQELERMRAPDGAAGARGRGDADASSSEEVEQRAQVVPGRARPLRRARAARDLVPARAHAAGVRRFRVPIERPGAARRRGDRARAPARRPARAVHDVRHRRAGRPAGDAARRPTSWPTRSAGRAPRACRGSCSAWARTS